MRKTLLFVIMCVFALLGNVKAQETVVVGTSSFQSWAHPMADYYNYSVCQQIYTAAELQGKTGTINKLLFEQASGGATTRDIVVYMKNIEKTAVLNASDWVQVSASDIVYLL